MRFVVIIFRLFLIWADRDALTELFALHQQKCLYPVAMAAACTISTACSDVNVISKPPSPHAIILI